MSKRLRATPWFRSEVEEERARVIRRMHYFSYQPEYVVDWLIELPKPWIIYDLEVPEGY